MSLEHINVGAVYGEVMATTNAKIAAVAECVVGRATEGYILNTAVLALLQ